MVCLFANHRLVFDVPGVDIYYVRPFKERECYKNDSYLEIKKSVNEFYRIVKVRY